MSNRYSIYSVALSSSHHLQQVDSWTIATAAQRATIIPGGLIDPAHIGIASATPTVSITTRDLTGIFAIASISAGVSLSSAAAFYMQTRQNNGTFVVDTDTNHCNVSSAAGFYYPTSITASQDSPDGAVCEGTYVPLWNGTTDPLVFNTGEISAALNLPAFSSRFFLGPVYHNDAQVAGVTSITVDPGIRYDARAFSGDPYPTVGSIMTREPKLTFTTVDMNAADALATLFGSAISTGLIFYLQKGVASGTRVAAATATHIKITAASGDWCMDDASIQQNDDGSVTFTAVPTTTLSLVMNSTIP